MDQTNQPKEGILDQIEGFVKTSIELGKLKATLKISELSSRTGLGLILLLCFTGFVFIGSISLAFWLAKITGEFYIGFLIVSGIYLILGIVLYAFRKKIVYEPLGNKVISEILKENQ